MDAELARRLVAIERKLWTNDPEFYRESLDDECVLVFPVVGVLSRDAAVDAIRVENAEGRHWAEVRFEDLRVRPMTQDATLLTYRAVARWANEEVPVKTLASSVYVRRSEQWKLALHQQTALND